MCKKVCTFFGHRDAPPEVYPHLKETIRYLIEEKDVSVFMLGNKGNFDKYAAQALHELKQDYPHIHIMLIIAYVSELNKGDDFNYYDGFDYPPEVEAAPRRFAHSARNRFMAKACHYAIIYVWHEWGGAFEASKIVYAQHKEVFNLYQRKNQPSSC